MSKPILCKTCKNYEQDTVLNVYYTGKILEECLYPDNDEKAGVAAECNEYEPPEEAA